MGLTTRRFVFPAFRQPQQNKNQPLVALKATILAVFAAAETTSGTEAVGFARDAEGCGVWVLFLAK